jgi:hypothetical protein
MTADLTPEHLFSHDITVHHYEIGAYGALATPATPTSEVTGRFQRRHRVIADANGVEKVSRGVALVPGDTTVGPNDRVEYDGEIYPVLEITTPSFSGDTPAYKEVLVE